jgi:hypothetical protein
VKHGDHAHRRAAGVEGGLHHHLHPAFAVGSGDARLEHRRGGLAVGHARGVLLDAAAVVGREEVGERQAFERALVAAGELREGDVGEDDLLRIVGRGDGHLERFHHPPEVG